MKKIIKYLDFIIYWTIILLPFSISIAPAPMNIFMGLLIAGFLLKKIIKRERIFTKTAIDAPLLLLFAITCLSLFNSVNLNDSLKGGVGRLAHYIFVFFIIAEELKDKRHIIKVLFSIGAGLALLSVDSIWQVWTGNDFIRGYSPILNIGLLRATASFKDSNILGIYLSALAPLIFGLALYYFKGVKKISFLSMSLVILTGVLLTYSRPTLLAVYISILFFGLVRKNKFLVAVLIIFTIIAPLIAPKTVKDWAKCVDYNPFRFMCNDDRIAVYQNCLNMVKAHPVIGVGANAFMKSYKQYKNFPEYRNVVTLDEMKAHNNFLQMAAEIGLLGLGIFLWLLYKLFKECMDIYRRIKDSYLKIVALSLVAGLIAFLVNGLTESSLYYSRVGMIFWYLMGFSLALKRFIHADRPEGY